MSSPVPGSGSLSPEERELVLKVQTWVTIEPDTWMLKVLPPGMTDLYLQRAILSAPPFDYRMVGGQVARSQDTADLTTPQALVQAFRLDHVPGFDAEMSTVDVMEFPATRPEQYHIPLGAPSHLDPAFELPADSSPVSRAADEMIRAAKVVGLDGNSYHREIRPWPYTGTGMTASAMSPVPERWRRYSRVPKGATISRIDAVNNKSMIAVFDGEPFGWRAL